MRELWGKFKALKKGKIFQIIVSIVVAIIAIGAVICNFAGIFGVTSERLLNIVIILLVSVVVNYVVEEIDIFEELKIKTAELPKMVENGKNEIISDRKTSSEELEEKIEDIKNKLGEVQDLVKDTHTTKGVIVSRSELERNISLDEVWWEADEVCLLAIANTSFLKGNGISKIKEAVNRGVKFKIVSLDPDYNAIKEYESSKIISPTSLPVSENVKAYINNCKNNAGRNNRRNQENNFRRNVEMRLTTYLLPYSMMIVKKNEKIKTIKVDLYGVDMEYRDRRSFYIPSEDGENIRFYEEQWNIVWENKEKTICVDLNKDY